MSPASDLSRQVAAAFVAAINQRSVDDLLNLMSADHVFIDGLGAHIQGKEAMRPAWHGYFRMVPDFRVTVEETYADGPVVVMIGSAGGTCSRAGELDPENCWSVPAAWRAVVRDGLVAEWRVFADNEPIRRILARNRS